MPPRLFRPSLYVGPRVVKRSPVNKLEQVAATIAEAGEGGGSLDGLLGAAIVTLTNAQIKALPTTPITTVPAQGANRRIVLIRATGRITLVADYTNIDAAAFFGFAFSGGQGYSNYLGNDAGLGITKVTDFLTGAGGFTEWMPYNPIDNVNTIADGWGHLAETWPVHADEGLTTEFGNGGSGNLTGGNAGNSLVITSLYMVVPV